jgi:hypothetical protein
MSNYATIIVHGILILFGLFGISVSVILMSALLFIGSAITFAAVCYSAYTLIVEYYNKKSPVSVQK